MTKTLLDYIKESKKEANISDEDNSTLYLKYIKQGTLELRDYQKNIIDSIDEKNTLVVLPTGLGKTIIAIVLSAIRLMKYPHSNILVLAPTKPLVNQHAKTFKKFMDLPEEMFVVVSGEFSKEKRKELWSKRGIFFATPQTVKNDIENSILDLSNFSLLVVDEAHRSVGDYAYTFVARKYIDQGKYPLILGLTASPGGELEKIGSVIGNLFIENVEVRSYNDEDVRPYIKETRIEWIHVDLPQEIKKIDALLGNTFNKRIAILMEKGFVNTKKVSKKELLELQKKIGAKLSKEKSDFLFYVQSIIGQLIKIQYSIELVETQGLKQFISYYEKLSNEEKKTKSLRELLEDEEFKTSYVLAKRLYEKGIIHPKMDVLKEKVKEILSHNEKGKIIIFTQYVETASIIADLLSDFGAVLFIGQRKGYSQKKQLQIIEDFREGKYKILVATSVAEEGLDIPAVDVVIFYEPIPSEIRSIQRRGRTGRFDKGRVIVLITKKTLDEAYYWSAIAKERNMRRTLHILKQMFSQKFKTIKNTTTHKVQQIKTISSYTKEDTKKVHIIFDKREEKLYSIFTSLFGTSRFYITKDVLNVGDVVIDNSVVIERKTANDFISSIIDGRLFSQLEKMLYYYDVPILMIEGDLHKALEERDIHDSAVRGVISKIVVEYHIPIIWSKDIGESARYIYHLAKRFEEETKKERSVKHIKKPEKLNEQQLVVVESLPNISGVLAKRLLKHFKTIRSITNASIDQLKEVEGIGDKKAQKIYEVFNKEYIE